MPGGSARKGVPEKLKDLGHFYKSKKSKKGRAASSPSPTVIPPSGAAARGEGCARCSRPVVPTSPIPSIESDGEEEEDTQFVREERPDGSGSSHGLVDEQQGDEQHEGEEEDEEEVVEEEFLESDKEILELPQREKVRQRGPANLPKEPYEARHIKLVPSGKRCFLLVGKDPPPRSYSSIIGCLPKKHFPRLVKMPSGRYEVAWTWDHYVAVEDVTDTSGKKYDNVAMRVVCHFWKFFTQVDGHHDACIKTLIEIAKKLVPEMHYEARVCAMINWYAEHRKIKLPKHLA